MRNTMRNTMRKKARRKPKSARRPSPLGLFQALIVGVGFYIVSLVSAEPMLSSQLHAQTAKPTFRPIGSGSLVDQYERRPNTNPPIRQVAMQSGGFSLPQDAVSPSPGNSPTAPTPQTFSPPPQTLRPSAPALQPAPVPQTPNVRLPNNPSPPPTTPLANSRPLPNKVPPGGSPTPRQLPLNNTLPLADYQPVPPPEISNGGFATMGDCRLISPPSSYTAMSPYGTAGDCGCGVAPAAYAGTYTPPPAQIAAPAAMPPLSALPAGPGGAVVQPGGIASPTAAPVKSLVTFGQENYPVQVGQGLWGQPVAYVPGQSVRNWLRYMSF